MTYDNTDTNADGAIDAPVDNESVSTEKAVIGSYPTVNDVPTGEPAGFISVTEDGHLVVEDGQ